MKHRKTLSAILAAAMFCTALPAFPSAYAAESTVPDWIPTNYGDACDFSNLYGSTRVEDDLICIVTCHWGRDGFERLPLLGSGNYETLLDEWYCGKTQMNPDKYCHVTVYKPTEAKTVVFYDCNTNSEKQPKEEDQYIFAVDADLHVAETDWRAFVPDSSMEYNDLLNDTASGEYGLGKDFATWCNITGNGNYLLMQAINDGFCGSIMYSKAVLDGQELTLKRVDCSSRYKGEEPTDRPTYFVDYCTITQEGTISATFTQDKYRSEGTAFSVTKTLSAAKNDDGRITVSAIEEAKNEEWRQYVPDTSEEAYAFLRSEGLVFSDESYHEFNIDNRGDYLILATASYGGLSPAYTEISLMKGGKTLKTTSVDCKPESGIKADGECYIEFVRITEPCVITADIRGYQGFRKTVKISATRDSDGRIRFKAEPEGEIPDWIPSTPQMCEEFRQTCGDWHAQDGIICLCLPYEQSENTYYVLDDPGTAGDFAKHETLTTRQYAESGADGTEQGYTVAAIKVTTPGNVGMKWVKVTETDDGRQLECKKVLFFTADEDLNIRDGNASEDEFDFLPKTFSEAQAYYKENGAVSVQDGYLVCCGKTNVSTGYDILAETAGTSDAELVKKTAFSYEPDDGSTGGNITYRFFVYKPKQKGQLKISVRHAREWEYHDGTVLNTKYYQVAEDLSLKEFRVIMGDLNGDGEMTVADAVALSKYLGGTGRLEDYQFFAADLLNDNRINAADLSLMKRQLAGIQNPPPPGADA